MPLQEVQAFLHYVRETQRGEQPGVDLLLVSTLDLDTLPQAESLRQQLDLQLAAVADTQKARWFSLGRTLFVLVPEQTHDAAMRVGYRTRMTVNRVLAPALESYPIDSQDLVRPLHSRRDVHAIANVVREFTRRRQNPSRPHTTPLSLEHIAAVEQHAATLGITAFARRYLYSQNIAALTPGNGAPQPVGREVFIGLKRLVNDVLPGVDPWSRPNLFRELTLTLDRLVLSSLAAGMAPPGDLSVNLNLATLLDEGVTPLLRDVEQKRRGTLWLELRLDDLLAHYRGFMGLQKDLAGRGVRIMLDHVWPDLLTGVDPAALGVHGCKVLLEPEGADAQNAHIGRLRESGLEMVAGRVEDPAAVEAGHAAGIQRFQGFYIDRLLQPAT